MTTKKPIRPTIFLRGSGINRPVGAGFVFAYIGDAKRDFERDGGVDTEWLESDCASDDDLALDDTGATLSGPTTDFATDIAPTDPLDTDPSPRTDGLRPRPLRRRYAPANTRALVIRSRVN